MTLNEGNRPLKRMKRTNNRVTADHHYAYLYYHDFFTFSVSTAAEIAGDPFRSAVQKFLSKHARVTCPLSLFPWLLTWQMAFRLGDLPDAAVVLDIVEEDVTRSTSRSVYCDQCRVVGWSGHPVCRKRYHFIIRGDSHSNINNGADDTYQNYDKTCPRCGYLLHLSDSRCKSCNTVITTDDVEEWVYSQLEDNTHLLHGVIHSNGYGHLLTVNGREGGSKLLSGSDIMNFWDRLCTSLAVRKVTVMDMSKKYGMEYRLLHAITKRHTWYGNWGYEFKSGSYAITLDEYQKAVDTLSSIPLSSLFQGRGHRAHLQAIISFYQFLSESELLTIKELISFMIRLIHETRKPSMNISKSTKIESTTNILCKWTTKDVEHVQQGMIKVLSATETSWVTRRALKGVMCKVASPELLDYCLKHLGGKLAANGMVVQAKCNPNSRDVEFRLEPSNFNSRAGVEKNYPSEEHIKSDIKFLYDSLLHPETMVNYKPQALRERVIDSATKLLDCKQFIKDYKLDKATINDPLAIHLWCHVELSDQTKDDPGPPPEMIVLPSNATVGDLKSEATNAFQDVYAMFKRFEIEKLSEYGLVEDSITLKLLVGSFGSIKVQGRCPAKHGLIRFRMERGTEEWTVDCPCGARDDDGERMLACDTCGVWQHTRCAGIDNSDDIPKNFVCTRCVSLYCHKSNGVTMLKEEGNRVSACVAEDKETNRICLSSRTCGAQDANRITLSSTSCRAEVTDGRGVASRLTVTFRVG